jgi:hypothetical protein
VGEGKIMVCGTDLLTDQEKRLEAKQLLYSLVNYMSTPGFQPVSEISIDELEGLVK